MNLSVVILAAGKGKRMATSLPKVLHKLGGYPLLEWVVKTSQQLKPSSINVVYGNAGGKVKKQLDYLPVNWVDQQEQLGTGHAVLQALPNISDDDRVLVLFGDVPLISQETLMTLIHESPEDGLGVLVAEFADPTGLGRILRNVKGDVVAVVEHRDATDVQKQIQEVNTGIITAPARLLKQWLPKLDSNNDQNEYYLTDIIALSVLENIPVKAVFAHDSREVQGVNDLWQLAMAERYYQQLAAKKLMLSGVKVVDPNRIDLRGEWEIGRDVTIDVNTILEGKNKIGCGTTIGANVFLKNVTIGDNVKIEANTVIEDAIIHNDCSVGPFARIRPGTILKQQAKVGNFVETKKTTIGVGSKASHLTYLGDTVVGSNVNIGAGTITCNYDGVNKFPTVIHDGAFVGSNTSLVAPIEVGKNATIGAGSTVSKQVPAEQLTVARAKQMTVKNWHRPIKHDPSEESSHH